MSSTGPIGYVSKASLNILNLSLHKKNLHTAFLSKTAVPNTGEYGSKYNHIFNQGVKVNQRLMLAKPFIALEKLPTTYVLKPAIPNPRECNNDYTLICNPRNQGKAQTKFSKS